MMKDVIIKMLVALLSLLDKDTLKVAADAVLDAIENKVESTHTQVDDVLILPLIGKIRDAFGIPDND